MAELEKAGIPTVSFVAQDFVTAWQRSAPVFGIKELAKVIVPRPLVGMRAEDIHPLVDRVLEPLVERLLGAAPADAHVDETPSSAEIIRIEGGDRYEALEAMNRLFLAEGWGDGFPLWAPTRDRVDAMLAGTRRAPSEVVATVAPGMGQATVEKIAVNALMAGCRPEHMPLLIAAVECISDPRFMMRNVAASTGAHAPLMLVNGPIAKRLGVNAGRCALGPGAQSAANTVLGRAMRLFYLNLGHAYPGISDMDTLGSPTKYSMCLAENEDESPWEPFHVERGFDRDASVVTMTSTYAITEVEDGSGTTPEALLDVASSTACNQGVKSVGWWLLGYRADPQAGIEAKDKSLLIVCPVHAAVFRKYGWTKPQVREYLYKRARIPFGKFMANKSANAFRLARPELQWLWDSPDTLLPVLETPECFEIMVAGGMGGARSTYSYGAAEPVSRLVGD